VLAKAAVAAALAAGSVFVSVPTVSAASGADVALKRCDSRLVRDLYNAGFRGERVRIAYAIVMRESGGTSWDERSPYYTGALGAWQIQTSAHSSKWWWSRSAMLDRRRQTHIVFKYMTNGGRNWSQWGITRDGNGVDASAYRNWSTAQVSAWIWRPYAHFKSNFPRKCKGVLHVGLGK
jgi:hypothetical protein